MDFRLPPQARVHMSIPKSRFFERVSVGAKLRREFVDTVRKITWEYKLAPETIGIPKTESVEEVQIFLIELKERTIPKGVLKMINRSIPYPVLFVLSHDSHTAYGIALRGTGEERYYFSEWDVPMRFDFSGLTLEALYQGLVKEFIGTDVGKERDFATMVETDKRKTTLEREIRALESKMRSERQFNKKVELSGRLRLKKAEFEELTSER